MCEQQPKSEEQKEREMLNRMKIWERLDPEMQRQVAESSKAVKTYENLKGFENQSWQEFIDEVNKLSNESKNDSTCIYNQTENLVKARDLMVRQGGKDIHFIDKQLKLIDLLNKRECPFPLTELEFLREIKQETYKNYSRWFRSYNIGQKRVSNENNLSPETYRGWKSLTDAFELMTFLLDFGIIFENPETGQWEFRK